MEKFHKYCLSVLLVIICSNISAQIGNGTVEIEDCKQLYELYNQILNHDCKSSREFCVKGNAKHNFAINQKQNAIDLIGKVFPQKQQENPYCKKNGAIFSEKERHNLLVKNFKKNSKQDFFAAILYFKTKVSKIRNKDYLELMG